LGDALPNAKLYYKIAIPEVYWLSVWQRSVAAKFLVYEVLLARFCVDENLP
jgi:hypothetical protein